MVGFVEDKRGAVAIQVALSIPILVIILLGAYGLWKVLCMQQVVNDASYQGARLMTMQPLGKDREGNSTEIIAEQMIRHYLSQAALVDPAQRENPGDPRLKVVFQSEHGPFCGSRILTPRYTPPAVIGHSGSTGTWLFYCPQLDRRRARHRSPAPSIKEPLARCPIGSSPRCCAPSIPPRDEWSGVQPSTDTMPGLLILHAMSIGPVSMYL